MNKLLHGSKHYPMNENQETSFIMQLTTVKPIFKNLTGYEIDTLSESYNLTDGHAFRPWSAAEEEIIGRSADLFRQNNRQMQAQIERDYIRDFLALGKQTLNTDDVGYLMCFTASMAFEIIANYLRLNNMSLCLVEPCFDNLADIYKRHQIPMESFPDVYLDATVEQFEAFLETVTADVICLVTPNNPTGTVLSEENTRCLVEFCKENNKLLILDNCFRAYMPRNTIFDQYQIALETDIDFMMIEDTGKTWPTVEVKAPFFSISKARGLYDSIYDIYTDFLLHISPFGIKLVHEFIKLSQKDEMGYIHQVTKTNRDVLYKNLRGTFLTPIEKPFASMSWLHIENGMTGFDIKQMLDEQGIFILPGNYFYWSDKSLGRDYIRVALSRDPEIFEESAELLGRLCR